jgi:hypothetical protein
MTAPGLKILGVYRPVISEETWHEQLRITGDDDLTREHFERLVLIEATVEDLDGPFKMIEFGQTQPAYRNYPPHMQVGYDEGLLSEDGETLIQRKSKCVHGKGPLRFAVYLHLYDPDRPLQWQEGTVMCPPIQDVPLRLAMLMPYRSCN